MKATGIVRKIDDLGRLVIPKELRQTMGLDIKDPIEIYVDDGQIILRKFERGCMFCGSAEDAVKFEGRDICLECRKKLSEIK